MKRIVKISLLHNFRGNYLENIRNVYSKNKRKRNKKKKFVRSTKREKDVEDKFKRRRGKKRVPLRLFRNGKLSSSFIIEPLSNFSCSEICCDKKKVGKVNFYVPKK